MAEEVARAKVHHKGLAAFFALLCLLFLFFMRPYLMLGDGATARHIATGNYMFGHLKIPTTNYVWALNPDAPWTTHELIGDLLLAAAYQMGGLNGVVVLGAVSIGLAFYIVVSAASRRGAGLLFGSVTTLLALAACSLHWSARAHLFSYVMLAWLYWLVYVSETSIKRRVFNCFILFVLWSNVHGSTILGLLLLIYLLIEAGIKRALKADVQETGVKQAGLLLLSAAVGSFFTVRGLGLVSYVVNYFFHPSIRNQSDEWRSLDFSLGFAVWTFLVLFAILITVWTFSPRKPRLSEFLFVLTLGFGGLYAMRIIPYFALLAVPAAAYCWPALRAQLADSNLWAPVKNLLRTDADFDNDLRFGRFLSISGGAIGLAAALAFLTLPSFKLPSFDKFSLPVGAVAFLEQKNIHGLGFTRDNWGGYVNLETTDKIFLDDKTDFYPPEVVNDYAALYLTYPEWRKIIDKYKFEYIMIPSTIPLTFLLSDDPHWTKAYADDTATIFLHANGDAKLQQKSDEKPPPKPDEKQQHEASGADSTAAPAKKSP